MYEKCWVPTESTEWVQVLASLHSSALTSKSISEKSSPPNKCFNFKKICYFELKGEREMLENNIHLKIFFLPRLD